uniref:G-protein coupled receptors family 3 profile domain-containing protein n=1 Tax=Panagrolaimus superbus TaxID=310955 RepID=A0A914YTE3_9BILA
MRNMVKEGKEKMARLEVHMEASIMNDEEVEALRERVKCYRRQQAAVSHQQILKNVAKHALSLTPPRSAATKSKTPSHFIPIDDGHHPPASCMPRKVIYSNSQKTQSHHQNQKQQQQETTTTSSSKNSMPVTKIGVMSHPKPLSPLSSPPVNDSPPPLQTYNEWKNRQSKKNLPKVWKQTDTPPGEEEEETKIELPESLTEREEMVQEAQKKNDDIELIPVDPSKSFEKFHLYPSPSVSSSSTSTPISNLSFGSTLPPPSGVSSSTEMSTYYSSTDEESSSNCSNKSSSNSQEALSPPYLIVPKTINALAANNIGKVYITDKLSDLDKLVLATAFSPVPVKQKPPKHAGKSKSDFAIHRKNRSPFKSLFKKSSLLKKAQSMELSTPKFPPERNIDVCKQYEIVKAVRFPNTWVDEMEAIAIIAFLIFCTSRNHSGNINSVKEIILASFYTIHQEGIIIPCEVIVPENIILTIAHTYSIKKANDKIFSKLGLKLISNFADTCDTTSVALQRAVGIIGQAKNFCESPTLGYQNPHQGNIIDDSDQILIGATGVFRGEIGDSINYLFTAFCLPVIASASSSAEMDNPINYPYFLRTGASDIYKAQVIFDILQSQLWYHVVVVYDSSSTGTALTNQLKTLIQYCNTDDELQLFRSICIENYFQLSFFDDSSEYELQSQRLSFAGYLNKSTTRVITLLMEDRAIDKTLLFINSLGFPSGHWQFVLPSINVQPNTLLEYAFAVQEDVEELVELNDIIKNITLENVEGYTNSEIQTEWIQELIEMQNLCCWQNLTCAYSLQCDGTEKISIPIPDKAKYEALHVYNAIMLLATAVENIHSNYCKNESGICQNMIDNARGQTLLKYLMNAKFDDDHHKEFSLFNRSATPVFNVFQMQKSFWNTVLYQYNPYIGPIPSIFNFPILPILDYDNIVTESRECQPDCNKSIIDMRGICCFGILATVILTSYIYNFRKTPMVMASTPDLCYLQSATQILLFIISGLMLPSPNMIICGSVWAISTVLLVITHAIFLIKAIRLSRPKFYTKLISYANTPAKSSGIMLFVITISQTLISVIWVLLRPPTAQRKLHEQMIHCRQGLIFIILLLRVIVRQARIGLAGTLCFIANYGVLLPLIFMEGSPAYVRATILMCIPLLTATVSLTTMHLPISYELFFRKKQNCHEYVSRERSRQFQAGNFVYYVDAMLLRRANRTRTQTSVNSGL